MLCTELRCGVFSSGLISSRTILRLRIEWRENAPAFASQFDPFVMPLFFKTGASSCVDKSTLYRASVKLTCHPNLLSDKKGGT